MESVESTAGRQMVEAAACSAVTRFAPEERELFPLAAEAFFAEGRLPARRRIDDRLGIGHLTDVVITISPIALMIANEAGKALIGEATKTSVKAVGRRIVGRYRAWRRRKEQPPEIATPGAPTEEAELRARLIGLAVEHALSEEDAARLVDAVLEQLTGQARDA